MNCPNCGFYNREEANFCKKCGTPLHYSNTIQQSNDSSSNKNLLIICITIIIILLIVAGTYIFLSSNESNEVIDMTLDDINITVNSVTFYSDGNPNTGETATINVGKEHAGKTIGVMTLYSRDGVRQNYPSDYENHVVDDDGDVVITDYTAMPRYPGHCIIKIKYNDNIYEYECNIGTYKGTQTIVPEAI